MQRVVSSVSGCPSVRRIAAAVVAVIVAGTALVSAQSSFTSMPAADGAAASGVAFRLRDTYGQLPLHFERNAGQVDSRVDFLARGNGYTLFLTPSGAVLQLRAPGGEKSTVLRLNLAGANARARVSGHDPLPGHVNYFIGNDPAKWRTGVPTFGRVEYEQVYPGIDFAYYGNQRQLEYDFIVSPGADTQQIAMTVEGANTVTLDQNGDLMLRLRGGNVRLHQPVAYQDADGSRSEVPVRYVVDRGRRIRFELAAYDRSRPLIIDPVLVYSTFLGGGAADAANGIAVDTSRNAYVVGTTSSSNFPTPGGPFPSPSGGSDVFVSKLSASGATLLYSTYLGGSGNDEGHEVAVDVSGNAYVTGFTASPTFPTTAGAYDTTHNSGNDAFIAKLNTTGSALVYSTFLGGTGNDSAFGIAVDAVGDAYVVGQTFSSGFPTVNAPDTTLGGGNDAFVAKLSPASAGLADLRYSTYLGGGATDSGSAIALDASGNVYVAGSTFSSGATPFPTPNGFDTTFGGGAGSDGFAAKLNPLLGASSLVYGTYLGGPGVDSAAGVAVDASGNIYVTGTGALGFPVTTANAFDFVLGGTRDAFALRLNPSAGASGLTYSTFLGGALTDDGLGIAVDAVGHAHVTGATTSSNLVADVNGFPRTADAVQSSYGGSGDAFYSIVNPALSGVPSLVYSTYLGGANGDSGNAIAVDDAGNAYLAGFTASTGFPVITGAYDTSHNNGINDAFIAKFGTLILSLTLDPPNAVNDLGSEHCVTATVADELGNAVQGVVVRFAVSGTVTTTGSVGTDVMGQGVFCYTGPALPGTDTITAYPDANGNAVQDLDELTATATKTWAQQAATVTGITSTGSPTAFGDPVTFTATVVVNAVPVTEGTVTFGEGLTILAGPLPLSAAGQAIFTTAALTAGLHTIVAEYSGTDLLTASSASIVHEVSKPNTLTTLASSLNPSTYGKAVSFTATVVPVPGASGVPSGLVTFFDGATALGGTLLNAAGQASLIVSTLVAGDHAIVAVYGGDAFFNGSASPALPHTVNRASTATTLSSSRPSPTVYGETVTFTALVEATFAIPTGTVAFNDGTTLLATEPVDSEGRASVALSSLTVGGHTISAVYTPADSNFVGSTADALNHTVVLAPTDTTVMSTPNPSNFGSGVTLEATVTAAAPGARTLTFTAPMSVNAGAAGIGTFAVASGDFNGDGRVDLVSANRAAGTVSVVLGNGDGTFGAPAAFDVGGSPAFVIAVDLDADGALDLATANETSNSLSALQGHGDGTFTLIAGGPLNGALSSPTSIAAGDFNGDGHLDLVASNGGGSTLHVRLGNGALGFGAGSNYGTGSRPLQVIAGHLDGDADLDLASVNFNPNSISLKANDGAGGFAAINTAPLGSGTGPVAFVLADFNGDGKLDVATANRAGGNVSVRLDLQTTTPIVGSPATIPIGADAVGVMALPEFGAAADFNGDGRLDLAVTDSSQSYVRLMTGTGGSFEFPIRFQTDVPAHVFATTDAGRRFIAADFNGDGAIDLALPTLGNDIKVLLNTSVGPTGTVQFYDGGTAIGVPIPLVNGTAITTTNALAGGTHALSAVYTSDGNYAGSTGSTTHVVIAMAITVTADPQTKVYGNADPALTYKVTSGSLQSGDSFAGTLTRLPGENVGSYAIQQGTLSLSSNYTLTFVGADLVVTQRRATWTTNPASKVYGTADPIPLTTGTGNFLPGDDVTATYTRTPGSSVSGSPYHITATLSSAVPGALANYAITNNGANFTITPAALTVTADDKTRPVGDPNPPLTGQMVGLVVGDPVTATFSTSATASSQAGAYPIVSAVSDGGSGVLSNYIVTLKNGTLTVTAPDRGGLLGRMTGGGTFGSQRVHHGFTLNCDVQQGANQLEVNWSGGNEFHLERLTAATCVDDPAIGGKRSEPLDTYRGEGLGRYNGVAAMASWIFTDAGEPGKQDTATIIIRDALGRIVLSASGTLSNGNHQAHPGK